MARQKAIDTLTDAHVLALRNWIKAKGRNWKSELSDAWYRAGCGVSDYTPQLQQIRNSYDHALVLSLSTREVILAGDEVAAAGTVKAG